jgi:nicotinate-nucleotide adenylyltransferase
MQFFQRVSTAPARLGVLPGTFNPPTVAHLALARAALSEVDEVVFVLPQVFPHKPYQGASFDARVEMLRSALQSEPAFSIASTRQGLFLEIAAECRMDYGPGVGLSFLCGRDAAERIANWDYGDGAAFADTLRDFELLVAARIGRFDPPAGLETRIRPLHLTGNFDTISATEVRDRVANSQPWEHLVPPAIRRKVLEIYGPTGAPPGSRPGS